MRRSLLCFFVSVLLVGLAAGCGADARGSSVSLGGSGEITLNADQGVIFETGERVKGGPPFSTTDLYATANGSALRLSAGADKIVDPGEDTSWFVVGGIPKQWEGLDQVPSTTPSTGQSGPLLHAQQGIGFVLKNHLSPGYTKGWIAAATSTSVTIHYEPLQ